MSDVSIEELDKAVVKAIELANSGDLQATVNHCLTGLLQFGEQAAFLKILGSLAFKQKDLKHATEFYVRATQADPNDAIGWAGLGMVYGAGDQTNMAITALEKSVALKPDTPVPYLNLSVALMKTQRVEDALKVLQPASEIFPDFIPFHIWLGHAYSALNRLEDAVCEYRHVSDQNPDDVSVMLPLALLERDLGCIEQSSGCLEKILTAMPEHPVARFTLSQNLLISGDLENGFAAYEGRWDRAGMERPNLKSPLWQGEELAGKTILVYAEQGFGDAIQFIRYLPMLQAMGAQVQLKVHPRLHKLLSTIGPEVQLINEDAQEADYNIAMMSLPHYLKTTLDTVPAEIPYLQAGTSLIKEWGPKLERMSGNARLKVGLVWQGDPNSQSEKGRSVPFEELHPLFELANIHFFLIQKQDGLDQLADMKLPSNVTDLGSDLDLGGDAFVDTAAVMQCLDVVISSDTSPAHLAGALGCKTWIMLKRVPEWRWMLDRDDSPWYPSAKLYRQKELGNWTGVITDLKQSLVKRVSA